MFIHYQNAKGEERFLRDVIFVQNIEDGKLEAVLESGAVLTLLWDRIEGIGENALLPENKKTLSDRRYDKGGR